MKFKIDRQLIKDGYISERKHPDCDYYIYNYTAKTQFEQYWNEQTLNCRGLILDGEGNIIARPFSKFFNIGEYGQHSNLGKIPHWKYFDIFDKIDGSLGILYKLPSGEYCIATRGSFESEQAKVASNILNSKIIETDRINLKEFKEVVDTFDNYTLLFEVVYPENRIVVDYGNTKDLILLAGIDKETGKELEYEDLLKLSENMNFPMAQYYGRKAYNRHAFLKIVSDIPEGAEGFVLRFDNGLRVKIKSDEYVRLHRLITGISNKSIWDLLRNGQGVRELLDRVPDEFYGWVAKQESDFLNEYHEIEKECEGVVKFRPDFPDRKSLAEYVKKHKYPHIIFAMIDEKPYNDLIWKILRPQYSKPFKNYEK